MEILSNEDIFNIVLKLPAESVINLCRTNYRYSRLCNDWYLWSLLAYRDFKLPTSKFKINNPKISPYDRYKYIKNLLSNTPYDFLSKDTTRRKLLNSVKSGNVDDLEILLESASVDPSFNHNRSIILASENGHLNIVNRLLEDPRVDPSDQQNNAIILASENGHLNIVNRLLEDDRVDPSDQYNRAIKEAVMNGHINVVNRLLQDERVNPSETLILASLQGDLNMVNRLLQDDRVDPRESNNQAINVAEINEYHHIASVLRAAALNKEL